MYLEMKWRKVYNYKMDKLKCPNCQNTLANLKYKSTGLDVFVKDLYICPVCGKIYKSGYKKVEW